MRAIRCLLAAVLAAGIVETVVAAQPGGGFGFGGQDVDYDLVFTNTALQEEIKVTAEQKEKLKPIADKYADWGKKIGAAFKEKDKDKITEAFDEGKKVGEEAKKVRDAVLTDAQKKRLKQIGIQNMGLMVFNDPAAKGKGFGGPNDAQKATMKDVQDALKLTDSQKSTIKTVSTDFGKEQQEIFKDAGFGGGGGFDPEKFAAAQKKVDKARKEAMSKVEECGSTTPRRRRGKNW